MNNQSVKVQSGSHTPMVSVYAWAPPVVFLFYFIVTALLNRFASDDFEFLARLREMGCMDSIRYFYDHWNTRWAAIGLLNLVLGTSEKSGTLFFYHITSLSLLLLAFYRITGVLTKLKVNDRLLLASYLVMAFFVASFNTTHVFFWVNSSVMYLIPCICLLFILSEILIPSSRSISFAIIIVCALFTGGSYEPLVFTMMSVSALFIFSSFRLRGPIAAAGPEVIKSILLLSVLMISFAISYAGEGHRIRSEFLPDTSILFKIWVLIKSLIKMFFIFGPVKLLAALVFAVPFFIYGAAGKIPFATGKNVITATIVLTGLIFLSLFPLSIVMSEMGPERAWTQISLYITLYASLLAAWLGNLYSDVDSGLSRKFYFALLLMALLFASFIGIRQDLKYSVAYDQRMEKLGKMQDHSELKVVELKPLPIPFMLQSAEIDSNPSHFNNVHLKRYLGKEFDLRKSD